MSIQLSSRVGTAVCFCSSTQFFVFVKAKLLETTFHHCVRILNNTHLE